MGSTSSGTARQVGEDVGRDQVARLVRELGIAGARRQKRVRPTKSDDQAVRHPDLVERQFTASAPNRLWVAHLERHEALSNRAVMKGHRLPLVAASGQKLRAA